MVMGNKTENLGAISPEGILRFDGSRSLILGNKEDTIVKYEFSILNI